MSDSPLNAMIIDTDQARCRRLVSAMKSEELITPFPVKSFDEAYSHLQHDYRIYRLIFIAPDMDRDELKPFLSTAKNSPASSVCAFISVMSSAQTDTGTVTRQLLSGIDGVLQEPYSADGFRTVVEIARKMIQRDTEDRARKAMETALVDMLSQVDTKKEQTPKANPRIQNLHTILDEVHEMDEELFAETLLLFFEKLDKKTGQELKTKIRGYSGASKRVKAKIRKLELEMGTKD
jgi:hypothetical protein